MASSRIGTLCDDVANVITQISDDDLLPVDLIVYSVRQPYLQFSSAARAYVFPLATRSEAVARRRVPDREIIIAVTLTQLLAAGTESAQIAQQDDLLRVAELLEELLPQPQHAARFAGSGCDYVLTEIDSTGGRDLLDRAAAEQDSNYIATLQIQYAEMST